jgi:hypothetical protein
MRREGEGAGVDKVVNWGTAGNVQPNGDDYRPHEIREIAVQLLKERLRS